MWNLMEKRDILDKDLSKYTWKELFQKGYEVDSMAFKESTYFKCIKKISESIAKVPLDIIQDNGKGNIKAYNHRYYDLVRHRSNPYMTAIDFWKAMEARRQHYGEAFALITRDKNGFSNGLYPIDVSDLIIDNAGLCKSTKKNAILVKYTVKGKSYDCRYEDVIHLKGFTLDGMESKAIKSLMKDIIETNKSSQAYQKDLFNNGLTNKAVVQMTSDIKDEKELKKTQAKFNRIYGASGRVFTVPAGYEIKPLNLSLADSQFSELRKLGAIDIATTFGVPPHMVGFMEGYNNNSLEQSNLSFLVDTLLILFESIEEELNYKLLSSTDRAAGYKTKFNIGVLLRTSQESQCNILTKYVQAGIYTLNDAREVLDKPKLDDGDDILVASGVYKLKDLSKITMKGGENNGETEGT